MAFGPKLQLQLHNAEHISEHIVLQTQQLHPPRDRPKVISRTDERHRIDDGASSENVKKEHGLDLEKSVELRLLSSMQIHGMMRPGIGF